MGTLNTTLNQTSLLSTCQQYHVAWKVELSHMHWELSEGFKKWDIPNWARPLRWGAFEAAKFILALIPEKHQEPKRHAQSRAEMAHVCTQSRKYTPPRIKMVIILPASTSFLSCLRHFFDLLIQVNDCDGKSVIKKPDSYMEHRAWFGLKCFI